MKVCIRGYGKNGKDSAEQIEYYYPNYEVCFADRASGINTKQYEVYTVKGAVSQYITGSIDKFVIPYLYDLDTIMEIAEELIEDNVSVEDIFIFHYPVGHEPHFIGYKEYINFPKEIVFNFLWEEGEQKSKYRIVICGQGWLARAVSRGIPDAIIWDEQLIDDNSIYLICEDLYMELTDLLCRNQKVINLYQFLMRYYFSYPLWYYTLCNLKVSKRKHTIVSGLSYIRDSVEDESILNIANSGSDILHDFKLFQHYYDICETNHIKIKNVVIGLGPYSLRYSMEKSKRNHFQTLLYIPLKTEVTFEAELEACERQFYKAEKIIKSIWNNFNPEYIFFRYYVPTYGIVDRQSQYFSENISKTSLEHLENSIRNVYNKPYEKTVEDNKRILEEYVQYCLQNRIRVLFYIPPYSQAYKRAWKKEYLYELLEYLNALCKKYHLDILNLSNRDYPDWYFQDIAHLNITGKQKCSQILIDYLEKRC